MGWGWKSWFGRKSPWRKIYANSFAGVSACRMVGEYTGRVWFAFSPAWNAFAANENPWSVVGGSRCTPEESESGRMDTILANPESRILLNIARALNFLPIKPPASLPAFSPLLSLILSLSVLLALDRARSSTPPLWSATPFLELCNPCSSFVLSPFLSLSLSLSLFLLYTLHLPSLRPSNLIQSLPARFPGRIGYSVTAHEHRLISIPATQLPSKPPSIPRPTPRFSLVDPLLSLPRLSQLSDHRNLHGSAALSGYVRQILSRIPGFRAL